MKRCPKCSREYDDNTLEFCLEDGARLLLQTGSSPSPTIAIPYPPRSSSIETVNLPNQNIPPTVEISNAKPTVQSKGEALKKTVVSKSFKVLETLPIIISLAHNYWQWLYVNNQGGSDLAGFITSAHFLIWLLLLLTGAIFSLLAIKYCQNKGFAYTSVVILAINLILFLVPRR